MFDRMKKNLKNNKKLFRFFVFFSLRIHRLLAIFVPDKIYIKWQYKKALGKELDLNNPTTFNEKIQWLKLNWRDEILTICADKYLVRDYVKSRVGEDILTKLYGVYDKVEDIVLDDFPESFVLKVTHGSGQNIICRNKKDMDWKHIFKLLRIFMANNHYYHGREFAYKNITPRIICEEYLDEKGQSPIDYKFCCFNGQPLLVDVHFDRFNGHKENFYDINWNLLPFTWGGLPNFSGDFNKPQDFNKMHSIAKELAKGLIFVRVDLFCVNNKVYFGEMTFYPANGVEQFVPESYDCILSSYLQLPIINHCGYNV
jgi:hypothetical protein